MASTPIYQFRAELLDYEPKIWRRFQVPSNVTMARLGYILMSMFEMQASHLFSFEVPHELNFREHMRKNCSTEAFEKFFDKTDDTEPYEQVVSIYDLSIDEYIHLPAPDENKYFKATEHSVKNALPYLHSRLLFTYDFGDCWNVFMELENIIIDKELSGKELPRVIEGKGYGIIEDCGGTPGLEQIAEVFKKKKGKKYKELCEWLECDDLNLEAFDIEDTNFRLKKIPRIYADIYENKNYPTKKSIDFLRRKYLK